MITRIRIILACLGIISTATAETPRVLKITDKEFHLGVAGLPEWQHFANSTPHGRELNQPFKADSNTHEQTLFIRHQDVKEPWEIRVNGKLIGQLDSMNAEMVQAFAVPPNTLRTGENVFSVRPPKIHDDILISDVRLESRPLVETLTQSTLEISVTQTGAGQMPCRITITDEHDALFQFHVYPGQSLAARAGVVYTRDGKARVGVPPGKYQIYAGRGFEYSVSTQTVAVSAAEIRPVKMEICREVPTPGLIACDTHIHNRTFSGHGDATVDERMLTIAGEGIELAVATDHNHHTAFDEPASRMRVTEYFTSVIGNEVTTKVGHFNAFPISVNATLPNHNLTNWTRLLANIRSTTGARVIQLNHPRDLHSGFVPLGEKNFNSVTGANKQNEAFNFDAIEVLTSAAVRSGATDVHPGWFALLNHGYRITGLGASDTHTVAHNILGQARSYVVCDDGNPANINVDAVCESFLKGRVYISQGLLTKITVNNKFNVGDLATNLSKTVDVTITVHGPSWTHADTVALFSNGIKIKEQKISSGKGSIEKAKITWSIPLPSHDIHLVAIATGPGITAPYWALSRPYQPTSKELNPRIVGSTNPIWLDADGDGKFTAARAYAVQILQENGMDVTGLLPALANYDEAVAAQAASLYLRDRKISSDVKLVELLEKAPVSVQRGFTAYDATVTSETSPKRAE